MNWSIALLLFLAGTAAASERPLYDLFGRLVDPAHVNLDGVMPAGELKLVLHPSAPRFGASLRRKNRLGRKSSAPPVHLIRLAPRSPQSVINVDQAIFATHLVKSGNRLILRRQ